MKGEVGRRAPFDFTLFHVAGIPRACPRTMRWITLYLVGYFMLLAGAAWALWESGILAEIPAIWVVMAALVAVWPALMLAVVSHGPTTPTRS